MIRAGSVVRDDDNNEVVCGTDGAVIEDRNNRGSLDTEGDDVCVEDEGVLEVGKDVGIKGVCVGACV